MAEQNSARMNLLFSYLVFYLGKIYVYVFTKIPTLYENLYLCESAEVFLYSEIETKKSFKMTRASLVF